MTVFTPTILLCAGGTGGHLFPAESLAHALRARGIRVALATDARVDAIASEFPASEVVTIASATPSGRSPLKRAGAVLTLGRGFGVAAKEIRRINPAAIVGFGGYPTVPPVLAGQILRVPTILHEQNAVMGRANAFLARGARTIATGFKDVRGVPEKAKAPRIHTGNPLRPAVIEAAKIPYPPSVRMTPCGSWSSAAARAPGSWARSCPRRSPVCPPRCAPGCTSSSRSGPRT